LGGGGLRTGELIVLNRADSLLEANPDSALHLLEAIDYNKLSREGQAHYGLLLTAARYKLDYTERCRTYSNGL